MVSRKFILFQLIGWGFMLNFGVFDCWDGDVFDCWDGDTIKPKVQNRAVKSLAKLNVHLRTLDKS